MGIFGGGKCGQKGEIVIVRLIGNRRENIGRKVKCTKPKGHKGRHSWQS